MRKKAKVYSKKSVLVQPLHNGKLIGMEQRPPFKG